MSGIVFTKVQWAAESGATQIHCHRWGGPPGERFRYTSPPLLRTPSVTSIAVSKQDTHFFNVFSLVIGLLVAIAIAIFALARTVASHTQEQQLLEEKEYVKGVEQRLQPFAKEAIAGQDNSALKIEATSTAGTAGAGPAVPKNGTELFEQACKTCHGPGLAGAPKAGDHAAWAPRIAKGKDVLYQHALQGFTGSAGVMPAKGGRVDVPDDIVKQAVDHMVEMAK
jgi:cytochrome c5